MISENSAISSRFDYRPLNWGSGHFQAVAEKRQKDPGHVGHVNHRCLGILDGKDGPSDRTKLEVVKSVGCTSHWEDEEAETSVKAYALAKLPWHSIGISWNPWKKLIKRLSLMILYTATMLWVSNNINILSHLIYKCNSIVMIVEVV